MIDILQIRKYDAVMEELDPSLLDDDDVEVDECDELEVIDENEELIEEDRGFNCLWDEVDEQGNEIPCLLNALPNADGTMSDYCPKHTEEHKSWLEILELYINDILKLCEPVLIKKMNKEQSGWKKQVEEQLGMTRYLITKFVNEKYKEGMLAKTIAIMLDNLDDE